jgi:solute carrier family 41
LLFSHSIGGLILDFTIKLFAGVAVFQPVINGVGGNLVAVQASRISTSFHSQTQLGILPNKIPKVCSNPWTAFFSPGEDLFIHCLLFDANYYLSVAYDCSLSLPGGHAMTARALILMVVPGHLIFAYTISYIQAGHTSITPVFLFFYLVAALIQV